jgi:nucleoside-diphosphate-sugar epimerase/putative sterol carrier protein
MKVAVTGGSGQLGTLILRRLIDDRSIKRIVSLDLAPPAQVSGKLEHVAIDVRDRSIGAHLRGVDTLIHLAFIITSKLPRAKMDDINVNGSFNVFEAAAAEGAKSILYASSVAAYGLFPDHPRPIVEETPRRLEQDFAYCANKFQVEEYLDRFEKAHPQIRVVRFRPTTLIGARPQNPLVKMLGQAFKRGFMPDTGGEPVPIVWDEDVADAFILALKKDVRGAFIVSADDSLPAPELARAAGFKLMPQPLVSLISRVTPALEMARLVEPVDPAWQKHAGVRIEVSSRKARDVLGWAPRCPGAVDVVKRVRELVPGDTDKRIIALFRMVNLLSKRRFDEEQSRGIEARVYLQLTGRGGGDFGLILSDSKLKVVHEIPRPPTSIATLSAATWLDLLNGRASFTTAQFTGKVRIEGDPVAAFILGGMIGRYRALQNVSGMRGIATRALSRWMDQGGAT